MWQTISRIITPTLRAETCLQQQLRTTFILKRRNPPYLHKQGAERPKRLRYKHFIYDLVEDTNLKKAQPIEVILTKYVDGVGKQGERLKLRPNYAYNSLLLPGLAVYATPEMIEKYKDKAVVDDTEHSSPTAQRAVNLLSRLTLTVIMNKDNPWTLKAWHLKNCFRRCGYHVPVECITLPEKPIKGPNMDYEGKEFYVTVTINNLEKVNVRCILHHWATDVLERLPHDHDFFKRINEPIFPEDAVVLKELPSTKIRVQTV